MNQYISQITFILFGITLLILIPSQVKLGQTGGIGPKSLPYAMAIAIILFSLLSIIITFIKQKRNEDFKLNITFPAKRNLFKMLVIFISIIFWIKVTPYLGFIITTILLLMITTVTIGYRNKLVIPSFAIITTLLLYLLFVKTLNVPLPELLN